MVGLLICQCKGFISFFQSETLDICAGWELFVSDLGFCVGAAVWRFRGLIVRDNLLLGFGEIGA